MGDETSPCGDAGTRGRKGRKGCKGLLVVVVVVVARHAAHDEGVVVVVVVVGLLVRARLEGLEDGDAVLVDEVVRLVVGVGKRRRFRTALARGRRRCGALGETTLAVFGELEGDVLEKVGIGEGEGAGQGRARAGESTTTRAGGGGERSRGFQGVGGVERALDETEKLAFVVAK